MGGDWAIYPIAFFICMILSRDIFGAADKQRDSMTTDRRRFWLFWFVAWVLGAGVWWLSHLRSGPLNVAEAMPY
jgi:hypothetical protein